MKDKIEWFGSKGNDGVEVIKTGGKAIGVAVGLVIIGATIGLVGNLFGGNS